MNTLNTILKKNAFDQLFFLIYFYISQYNKILISNNYFGSMRLQHKFFGTSKFPN